MDRTEVLPSPLGKVARRNAATDEVKIPSFLSFKL